MKRTIASGGVVIGPNKKILLVNQNGNSWSLPKGHVDDGEDNEQAAIREIQEESGVSFVTMLKKLGSYERHRIGKNPSEEDKTELKEIVMYMFTTPQENLAPTDPHNPEARWVEPDKVAELLTHPKDKAFFESILPQIKILIDSDKN